MKNTSRKYLISLNFDFFFVLVLSPTIVCYVCLADCGKFSSTDQLGATRLQPLVGGVVNYQEGVVNYQEGMARIFSHLFL